ncbi:alginate lyase family protein [Aestuariivirga litoralis]|uniref:alginate lyase family protein n=1 Tax=Aestuariivirga litoralis TaxID=2650924 RepID=UPI0018C5DCC5|nr:alginate lyase family protein [Aestuariivirga litoralis]MBG1233040.1 alginate lyase family protein [Aestuariivirga litoralis]
MKRVAREPKEFSIYRILGNDLPPRHASRSGLENLQYIIAHEDAFPEAEKWWILNRIVDPALAQEMIRVIKAAGHNYLVIPFVTQAHFTAFLDVSGLPRLSARQAAKWGESFPVLSLEWKIRHKSQALININHARNLALSHGQARSKWVLPFDGGIMFAREGWRSFVEATRAAGDAKFVAIGMQRIYEHNEIASLVSPPKNPDEPQIAFRFDAEDRFDEARRYGNKNKTELFRRIGVPGPWDKWWSPPWDNVCLPPSKSRGQFVTGGFTMRLPTHSSAKVENNDLGRWSARFEGVELLSAELDIAQAKKNFARADVFHTYAAELNSHRTALDGLCAQVMASPTARILDKEATAPSGNKQDFFCAPRYPTGFGRLDLLSPRSVLACVSQMLRPPRRVVAPESAGRDDRAALSQFLRDSSVLAHGAYVLGKKEYAARARGILETWILDKKTRMNPNLRFAQLRPERKTPNPYGLVAARDLWLLPQTVDTLIKLKALPAKQAQDIRQWCRDLLQDVEKSGQLPFALERPNNISLWTAVLAVQLYLFTGNVESATRICRGLSVKLAEQINGSGAQPEELKRHLPLHYSLFSLEAWAALACVSARIGINLHDYRGINGQSLDAAIRYLAKSRRTFKDYNQDSAGHDRRIAILLAFFTGEPLAENAGDFSPDMDWGLAPLWPLCMPRMS